MFHIPIDVTGSHMANVIARKQKMTNKINYFKDLQEHFGNFFSFYFEIRGRHYRQVCSYHLESLITCRALLWAPRCAHTVQIVQTEISIYYGENMAFYVQIYDQFIHMLFNDECTIKVGHADCDSAASGIFMGSLLRVLYTMNLRCRHEIKRKCSYNFIIHQISRTERLRKSD